MRYLILLLALAGIVVSALALHVHYSTGIQPCDINAHWDCGIVNRQPPLRPLRRSRRRRLGIAGTDTPPSPSPPSSAGAGLPSSSLILGLGFALYLSNIEAHVLEVWCLYCVISQVPHRPDLSCSP